MFIKELHLYINYLNDKIEEARDSMTVKQEKYLTAFVTNLGDGINYYHNLFDSVKDKFDDTKTIIMSELEQSRSSLHNLRYKIERLTLTPVTV
jgi:hypothetical protein